MATRSVALKRGCGTGPVSRANQRVEPTRLSTMSQGARLIRGRLARRGRMKRAIPFFVSCASGLVWAIIAYYVAYSLSGTRTAFAAGVLSGGMMAAPLIGVLIGIISREFSRIGRSGRIVMALG